MWENTKPRVVAPHRMGKDDLLRRDALEYHESSPPGKLTVIPTKLGLKVTQTQV